MAADEAQRALSVLLGLWQCRSTAEVVRDLGGDSPLTEADQALLLRLLDEDPILQRFPPRPDYTRKLLKAIMSHCEQHGTQVAEDVLCRYAASVCASQPAGAWTQRTYLHQPISTPLDALPDELIQHHLAAASGSPATPCAGDGPNSRSRGLVTLRVTDNMLAGGTGCHPWEAGFVLAELVLSHPEWFAGRRCLELGCGAGLVGVALHRACARSRAAAILLTDGDREALDNCCHNLALNGLSGASVEGAEALGEATWGQQVAVSHLDWTNAPPELAPDVLLGADLLYDPEIVPSLVALLRAVLLQTNDRHTRVQTAGGPEAGSPGQPSPSIKASCSTGGVAYIATKRRNERTLQLFLECAAGSGLLLQDVSDLARNAEVRFVQSASLQDRDSVLVHRISLPSENG